MVKIISLWPLSLLYGLVMVLREGAYKAGWFRSYKAPVPVISIGNLVAGGTGKTPLTIHLAQRLAGEGLRVAVLTRGYKRKSSGKLTEPLVVSDGLSMKCGSQEAGDEPFHMALRLKGTQEHPGAMVIVGPDRVAGAKRAADLSAQVIILDDGFQHLRLRRDLDIVLLDCQRPFDNGWLLPAGMLREPAFALDRAGVVVATRCSDDRGKGVEKLAKKIGRGQPVFSCYHKAVGLKPINRVPTEDLSGREKDKKLLLFSGIARPDSFRDSLKALGYGIWGHIVFGDHHSYSRADLERIAQTAGDCDAVVTTEKDAVKLPKDWDPGKPLWALEIEISFRPEAAKEALFEIVKKAVKP